MKRPALAYALMAHLSLVIQCRSADMTDAQRKAFVEMKTKAEKGDAAWFSIAAPKIPQAGQGLAEVLWEMSPDQMLAGMKRTKELRAQNEVGQSHTVYSIGPSETS